MPREARAARHARMATILDRLANAYPDSAISLRYGNQMQLLVAVILSAQCTDARVNLVTRPLFRKYKTVADFAAADPATFEKEIHSTGFFRSKTRNILAAARAIQERHAGRIPDTMQELVALPGVGRKTANVVLWHAFGKREGIAVDTHVTRLARLLGLTRSTNPVRIERDLVPIVPVESRGHLTQWFIDHGRAVCIAGRPRCEVCVLNDLCPSARRAPEPDATRGIGRSAAPSSFSRREG